MIKNSASSKGSLDFHVHCRKDGGFQANQLLSLSLTSVTSRASKSDPTTSQNSKFTTVPKRIPITKPTPRVLCPVRYQAIAEEDREGCVELYVLNPTFMASLWLKFPYVFRIGEHGALGSGLALLHERLIQDSTGCLYTINKWTPSLSPYEKLELLKSGSDRGRNDPDILQSINYSSSKVCLERGWKEHEGVVQDGMSTANDPLSSRQAFGWNLWWSHSNHVVKNLKSFSSWQLTNRTSRNFGFTSKDTCTRYIRRLRNTYGDIYDFCPLSFNVPSEYAKLCIEHTQRKSKAFWNFWDRAHYIGSPLPRPIDIEKQPIWICKPVGKSQGKGIVVFDTVANLTYNTRSVVQEYITRPHLIGDYKWDLRIYVVVVSISPLVFYAYREGLVRFATNPFDLKNLGNPFSHLTNSSVNKVSPSYLKNKIGVGRGCKWSLRKLRRYFHDKEIQDWHLWQRISAILILTIIGDASAVSNSFHQASKANTFFLIGFDIMVDRELRPVLVEVNSNPSLSNDCEVDRMVKKPMLHDLFDLFNLPDGREFESYLDSNPIIYRNFPTHPISTSKVHGRKDSFSSESEESSIAVSSNSDPGYASCQQASSCGESTKSNVNTPAPEIHFCSALYKAGPISAYRELLKLVLGNEPLMLRQHELTLGSTISSNAFEAQQRFYFMSKPARLEYPLLVTLPVKKSKPYTQGRSHFSQWRAGITLKATNWRLYSPPQVGKWIRIFPFNKETEKLTNAVGKAFDMKDAIRQVQELLKTADQLSKSTITDDASLDQLLKEKLQLTTRAWHPVAALGKKPRF